MEDKGIAEDAIESAGRWMKAAELNAGVGNYDSALYSLEMSAEIALKAVLLALRIDIPKTHNIADVFLQSVGEDKRASNAFGPNVGRMIETFRTLLELRSVSGYIYETRYNMGALKAKYESNIDDVVEIVDSCKKFVRQIVR